MSTADLERRMTELDRLLNDPEVRMDADRVWTLLAEISRAARPLPART
ncbi:cell division protein ZapD [Roseomonas eburnea]|uniref:Cell division protein ZapD n=1 Tax=Neoroseomonas eburnea TaxID=1346889 RepID=A0A9X9XBX5_9PROT|nr:peptide chain release factor 1 [Neoroseomonas eburnea]MBR0681211.1 cell division protein ZapD [Neoroseomonas eburnea]